MPRSSFGCPGARLSSRIARIVTQFFLDSSKRVVDSGYRGLLASIFTRLETYWLLRHGTKYMIHTDEREPVLKPGWTIAGSTSRSWLNSLPIVKSCWRCAQTIAYVCSIAGVTYNLSEVMHLGFCVAFACCYGSEHPMTGSMPTDYFRLSRADVFSRLICSDFKVMASGIHHSEPDAYARSLTLSIPVAIFTGNYADILEHRIAKRGHDTQGLEKLIG